MTERQWTVSTAGPADMVTLAAVASACQKNTDRRVPAFSDTARAIGPEIVEFGGETWWEQTLVARSSGNQIIGWLQAEFDDEIGRIWWGGPFVTPEVGADDALTIAGDLYAAAAPLREGYDQEEIAYEEGSALFVALVDSLGFNLDPASLDLHLDPDDFRPASEGVAVRAPETATDRGAVAAIHDELFVGTHTLGSQLVGFTDPRRGLLCADVDGDVAGYVATEMQHDRSLYVDYLGVRPSRQGHGLGRALVSAGVAAGLAAEATHAHLTVRVANEPARRLYRSLGFVEQAVLVPARKGFTLP